MQKNLNKLSSQARFVQLIIDGKLVVSRKKKADLIVELKKLGFKPIPRVVNHTKHGDLEPVTDDENEAEVDADPDASSFDYLLGVSTDLPALH